MPNSTVVLITGANSGVGYATARFLVQRSSDYHVIVASRVHANGEKAVAELQAESPKGSLSCLHLDVTDDKSIQSAAASVEKDFGRLDVLVNNAGMSPTRIDGDLRERLTTVMNTNALGAVMVTEAFEELLFKSKNPRLIYVSSGLGSLSKASDPNDLGAFVTSYPYQMSKAAMNMALVLGHKLYASRGVKAWAFCPGFVESNLRPHTKEMREQEKKYGMLPASTSAESMTKLIEGERDADVGKFTHGSGIYPW